MSRMYNPYSESTIPPFKDSTISEDTTLNAVVKMVEALEAMIIANEIKIKKTEAQQAEMLEILKQLKNKYL